MSEKFSAEIFPNNPNEKVPMHPEDYVALLEWVKAKGEQGNISAGCKTIYSRL